MQSQNTETSSCPSTNVSTEKRVVVIDGHSLIYRAFFGVKAAHMSSPEGKPTNAVYGFFAMFAKMIESFNPTTVICAFDSGRPQRRMEILPQYKAQRPPTDPDLKVQFPMIKQVLHAMNIPMVSIEGWEGDDILGTLGRLGEEQGHEVFLVTGDRDAYQLATDRVKIVSTLKGMTDIKVYGPAEVEERYGLGPTLVPDFYGLKGDTSDNIPGVKGIGEKKASALLAQYGSLDNLLAHADEVKGKMGENLREGAEDARISRQVATIMCDAPIDPEVLNTTYPAFEYADMAQAFKSLGFGTKMISTIARVSHMKDDDDASAATTDAVLALPSVLTGAQAKEALDRALATNEMLGVHLSGEEDIIAASDANQPMLFAPVSHQLFVAGESFIALFEEEELVNEAIYAALRRSVVTGFDLKALLHHLAPCDLSQHDRFNLDNLTHLNLFDITVAAYMLNSDRRPPEREARRHYTPDEGTLLVAQELLMECLDMSIDAHAGDTHSIGARLAAVARMLMPALAEELRKTEAFDCFNRIEMALLPVLAKMERTGMPLDTAALQAQSERAALRLEELTEAIHQHVGRSFTIDSPKQLGVVLFEELKLPIIKRTKTGYSTDKEVLAALTSYSPIPELILEYRELKKIKSTYLDALQPLVKADGRIHTTFNQSVAATGRLSSSDPNLQNIPVRSELGKMVRQAFVPAAPNTVILSADYSQIELRLLASLSGDTGLIEAFLHGEDFHAETASRVFGVAVDEVSANLRSRAKAVNFGIVYGQQAYGLSQELGISMRDAQEMIDAYYQAYPQVQAFLQACVEHARTHGYVATCFNRRRYTQGITSKNRSIAGSAERNAMNHPMQGSAADIIKLAMIRVNERMVAEGLRAKMIVQVHDELDFEVELDEVERLSALVREEMEGAASELNFKVPLTVEISTGLTWADAK